MKHPKQNKAVQPARSKKKVACPTCGVLYTPGVGLTSHIRFKHGDAPQAIPVAGNKAPVAEAAITIMPADPKKQLQTALDQLVARKGEIDRQLGGADALREEGMQLGKRIDAVNLALKAWDQQSMAASG